MERDQRRFTNQKSQNGEEVTMSTILVYSDKYMGHHHGGEHPERPARLKAIVGGLRKTKLWTSPNVRVIAPIPAKREDIQLAHDPNYVKLVEKLSSLEKPIDGDTPVQKNTFELALLAAGGTMEAGRMVMAGWADNAFALVRPPGHHAHRDHGGGFCYFNNLAIMVEQLKRDFNLKRIFVLDFDAHHGNGTQDIFYDDPTVLFMSIHQHPFTLYPGTGFPEDTGREEGEGYKVNVPMKPGSGDLEYLSVMREIFIPLCDKFKPQLFAVSAGFDAHLNDPLTGLQLSTEAYGWLAGMAIEQAMQRCNGKIIFALEGGYDLDGVSGGVVNVVKAMLGEKFNPPSRTKQVDIVDEVKSILHDKWKL